MSGTTYRAKLRNAALALLGGKCNKCGFADPRALEFDHIVPHGLPRDRWNRASHYVHKDVIAGDKNVQLLCANCHAIKTHEETHPIVG